MSGLIDQNYARIDPSEEPEEDVEVSARAFDEEAIPTEPKERVSAIPIPNDFDARPLFGRDILDPAYRAALKQAHKDNVRRALIDRAAIVDRMSTDLGFRALVMEKCRRDPVFFINTFGWSYDDREEQPLTPLVLFPRQAWRVVAWKENYVDVVDGRVLDFDEKSRAWGWTWIMAVWCRVWAFLFKEGWTVLYGHDKIEKLDDGGLAATHQTTFGKLRFAFRSLPEWFIPPGFWEPRNNKVCLIRHPTSNNMLSGDFYSSNFGRGDRFSDIVCDEAAASDNFGAAETSFKQTSRRIHVGTTPRGKDNAAGQLRWGNKRKRVYTLHWTDNPNLDVDWYWEQRKDYTVEQCAQEIDISWDRSVSGRVFRGFSRETALWDLDYDPLLPLYVLADPGFDDPFALVWLQPDADRKGWRIIDHLQMSGRRGDFYVPFILGKIPERTLDGGPWPYRYDPAMLEMIERHGRWKPPTEALGGADGGATSVSTGTFTLFDMFSAYGCPPFYGVSFAGAGGAKDEVIRKVEIAIPRIRIARRLESTRIGGPTNPTIVECFEQYSWVVRTSNKTGRKQKREPKHDIYCHAMDAIQMYFWWEDVVDPDVQPTRRPDAPTPPGGIMPDVNRRPSAVGDVIVVGQTIDPISLAR